jgi:hypothetical protein
MNNCKSTDFKYLSSKANAEKKLFDKGAIDVYNKIINLEIFNDLASQFLEFVKKEFNLDPTSVISGRFGDSVIFNNDVFRKVDKVRGYDKINAENIRKQLAELDKPSQQIKPGVEELFSSNPELANQVYEALGFQEKYKGAEKGDLINELKQITDPYLKELADLFIQSNINIPLYYSKGNDYAYVVPDNTLIISKGSVGIIKQKSIIHEVLHGGTSNNLLSNSDFKNRIESIINNIKQSDQQGRITFNYELENADEFISGLADKAFGNYLKQKGVFDEVITILKDNISFEKGFKITSEQKQQALQLYSQYLDTGKQDIEGFKEFVGKGEVEKKPRINYEKFINLKPSSKITKEEWKELTQEEQEVLMFQAENC